MKGSQKIILEGKNVDFNAGKHENEMTNRVFEPGTFGTGVRCPYPYTMDSLRNLAKKIKLVNIQWQKVANGGPAFWGASTYYQELKG